MMIIGMISEIFKAGLLLTVFLVQFLPAPAVAREMVREVEFSRPPVTDSNETRTLQSLVRIRKISETYSTGGLYLLTHFGDREELFEKENQKAVEYPMIGQTWRYCSVFAVNSKNGIFTGRNWDNQNVGSVIVNFYQPAGGYASVSFTRSIDLGFPLNLDLGDIAGSDPGRRLLLAPFYAYDGINDRGLCVAVAGVRGIEVEPRANKELIFLPYLIRKMLDRCKNTGEAVSLAETTVPFDLDETKLNCHLLIHDRPGRSVILEYEGNGWRKIESDKIWQILTNKPIYQVPEPRLKERCWRFRHLASFLEKEAGNLDRRSGMNILREVSQKGTTWSVVYGAVSGDLYFSVYQDWERVFHLKPFP